MTNSPILASLAGVLAPILLDFIMGVIVSLKQHKFSLSILPQFIATNLLPYVGGLAVLAVFAIYVPALEYLFYMGIGLVGIKFTKEALIDKLTILFS